LCCKKSCWIFLQETRNVIKYYILVQKEKKRRKVSFDVVCQAGGQRRTKGERREKETERENEVKQRGRLGMKCVPEFFNFFCKCWEQRT
jgi:hypothetical protein